MALIWPRLTAEDALNLEIDDETLRRDDVEELLDTRLAKEASHFSVTMDVGFFSNESDSDEKSQTTRPGNEASDLSATMDVGFFSNESASSFLLVFRFVFSCPGFSDFLLEDRSRLDDLDVFGFLF